MPQSTSVSPQLLQRTLKRVFNIRRLRDGQQQVIERVLAGLATLAVMPTGAGKSLCYQLPTVLRPRERGRTVVVSPLIALMKDQCDALNELGVRSTQMHSALSADELAAAEAALDDPRTRIVFTTPERLADEAFRARLLPHKVALLVVDEAHCISQWGHDFRPAFREIGASVEALGKPNVLALTATATRPVIDDITGQLRIPMAGVIGTGVYRPNLHYRVEHIARRQDKADRVVELVRAIQGSGIVYAATIQAAEELHTALVKAGESVELYHGRLPASRRAEAQDRFMQGDTRVMVATNAFGLGIDKPDIRFVLHHQIPPGLDAYYQESGRAGRDGEAAGCVLLYSEGDKATQSFFLAGRYPQLDDLRAVRSALGDGTLDVDIDELTKETGRPRKKLMAALNAVLHPKRTREAARRRAATAADVDIDQLAQAFLDRAKADRAMLDAMVAYAQAGRCRWQLLLEHFEPGERYTRCGHCDNCVRMASLERRYAEQAANEDEAEADDTAVVTTTFTPGQAVKTKRHGTGRVTAADALSVSVQFPDGSVRNYQPQFIRPLKAA